MKKKIIAFGLIVAMLLTFTGCPAPRSEPELATEEKIEVDIADEIKKDDEVEVPAKEEVKKDDEKKDDDATDNLVDDASSSVFPYIPTEYDPAKEYPVLYAFDGASDKSINNATIGNLSLYLDPASFETEEKSGEGYEALVFDSIVNSEVGPIAISLVSESIYTLPYVTSDEDGYVKEVPTLNMALDSFLENGPNGENVFTFYSENISDHYFSAAMYTLEKSYGFMYFFTDGEFIYSMQFILYNSDTYTDAQTKAMGDILNSIDFKLEVEPKYNPK